MRQLMARKPRAGSGIRASCGIRGRKKRPDWLPGQVSYTETEPSFAYPLEYPLFMLSVFSVQGYILLFTLLLCVLSLIVLV